MALPGERASYAADGFSDPATHLYGQRCRLPSTNADNYGSDGHRGDVHVLPSYWSTAFTEYD